MKRKKIFYQLDGIMKNWLGIIQQMPINIRANKNTIFVYPNSEYYIHDSYLNNVILVCADGTVIDEL